MDATNRRILLKSRPAGMPAVDHFEVAQARVYAAVTLHVARPLP